MKNLILTLFLLPVICIGVYAQKVTSVSVSTSATISEALEKCKEAGKKTKFGNRDSEANETSGKVTLWRYVGKAKPVEFFCYVEAARKDNLTLVKLKMPHHPKIIANYTKEVKKVIKNLELPNMMIGEYITEIE